MTEKENHYPSVGQSWGIIGIAILSTIVFCWVLFLPGNLMGEELTFLVYYVLTIGATFGVAHLKRSKHTGLKNYNFSLGSWKTMALVSIGVIAIQVGLVSPIVSQIPMPDFMKKMFLELANQKGIFSFITIVIAAPILEELIFRGVILDGLLRKHDPIKSIIFSSVLFGIIHFNPWEWKNCPRHCRHSIGPSR